MIGVYVGYVDSRVRENLIKTRHPIRVIFRRPKRGYERGHENRLLAWIPPSEVAPRVPVPLALSDKGVAASSYVCISDAVRCWKRRLLVHQIRLLAATRYLLRVLVNIKYIPRACLTVGEYSEQESRLPERKYEVACYVLPGIINFQPCSTRRFHFRYKVEPRPGPFCEFDSIVSRCDRFNEKLRGPLRKFYSYENSIIFEALLSRKLSALKFIGNKMDEFFNAAR